MTKRTADIDNWLPNAKPIPSLASMRIVRALTGRPPVGILDLTKSLGVTRTAVSEQLKGLLACGFVERLRESVPRRGRPRYIYATTPAASSSLFVGHQQHLLSGVWMAVRDVGGSQLVREVIEQIAAQIAEHYRPRIAGRTPEKRLLQVAVLLREEGEIVEVGGGHNGQFIFRRRSCPFVSMLDEDRCVCQVCFLTLSTLVGCSIRRVSWRIDGDPCCVFEISATASKDASAGMLTRPRDRIRRDTNSVEQLREEDISWPP